MTTTTQIILVLAVLAGIFAYWLQNQHARQEPMAASLAQVQVEPLPAFTLPDLNGQPRDSSEWAGKVLVINFWATWCPPCLKEIPIFMDFQQQYAAQGLQFIGIALDELEQVKLFAERLQMNYPNLVDERAGMQLARQLGNRIGALPYTAIVNRQGEIVHRHPGDLTEAQLNSLLLPLLETAPTPPVAQET